MKLKYVLLFTSLATMACSNTSVAMTLEEAVGIAVDSNPQILQSFENREAIEFELRQARGAFLPTLDLDFSTGIRELDNASRRSLGIENDRLNEADIGLTMRQSLYDGGSRQAELARQAARVDSASYRALDRVELVVLAVVREYLEYLLQSEVVSLARENLQQVNSVTEGIDVKIQNDVLTLAEGKLARERRQSASVRMKEAQQDLLEASVRFERLVGQPLQNPKLPKTRRAQLPNKLADAIAAATADNPRIGFANADINVAMSEVEAARSSLFPQVNLEATARYGSDIDGAGGTSTDLAARVVATWNIFNGGRSGASVQEQVRRAGEAQYSRDLALRETVELVTSAWNRRIKQGELAQEFKQQANLNAGLVNDYKEQFDLDQRSLLDVLGAQNTRFNVEISARNATYASLFAEYEIFAAMGILNKVIGYGLPEQTEGYARAEFKEQSEKDASSYERLPSRQFAGSPLDLLAPLTGN